MAAVDTIQEDSRCYCLSGTSFERAVLYLLNQIAGGTMTIDEIQSNSRCYCLTGVSFERAVLYLLDQINQNGGGGGGAADPVDNQALGGVAPVASTKNIVHDTDTDFFWYSSTKAAPWVNF